MRISLYEPQQARALADLFHRAVHGIDPAVYNRHQQEAWAPTPPDYEFWQRRLDAKKPWLAIDAQRIAGFIELDRDGHIDCLYVDPGYQRRGVAALLYAHLEVSAREQRIGRLYVEASLIARPFFERQGFRVLCRNEVRRSGQGLVNFAMEKML
ncbi:acetyltransferase [Marinobacterium nitratireducens]|uniref:Acetyltransferase n=1 Tax=Marinobacterium nitratireducens TaxID=518897 RepID=A0A917ZA01_9GAMM|nr:GNAT family N-acetyltransferase [Marinobacterium nitratireducens]GGO77019.1 acetyltransferase [Marinobacterium nitratireducens]